MAGSKDIARTTCEQTAAESGQMSRQNESSARAMLALWVSVWRRARRESTFGMAWKVAGSAKCATCAFESLLCEQLSTHLQRDLGRGSEVPSPHTLPAKMVTNGPHSPCKLQQQGTFMRSNYVQDCKGLWGAGRKVGFEHFAARTRESRCKRPLNILEPSYRMPQWPAVMGVCTSSCQTVWSCRNHPRESRPHRSSRPTMWSN